MALVIQEFILVPKYCDKCRMPRDNFKAKSHSTLPKILLGSTVLRQLTFFKVTIRLLRVNEHIRCTIGLIIRFVFKGLS